MKEDDQALAAWVGIHPVQFLGEAGLESFNGDRSIVGSFDALERAVECLQEFFIHI